MIIKAQQEKLLKTSKSQKKQDKLILTHTVLTQDLKSQFQKKLVELIFYIMSLLLTKNIKTLQKRQGTQLH